MCHQLYFNLFSRSIFLVNPHNRRREYTAWGRVQESTFVTAHEKKLKIIALPSFHSNKIMINRNVSPCQHSITLFHWSLHMCTGSPWILQSIFPRGTGSFSEYAVTRLIYCTPVQILHTLVGWGWMMIGLSFDDDISWMRCKNPWRKNCQWAACWGRGRTFSNVWLWTGHPSTLTTST